MKDQRLTQFPESFLIFSRLAEHISSHQFSLGICGILNQHLSQLMDGLRSLAARRQSCCLKDAQVGVLESLCGKLVELSQGVAFFLLQPQSIGQSRA